MKRIVIGRNLFFKPESRMIRDHLRSFALYPRKENTTRPSEYADKTRAWRRIVEKVPTKALKLLDPVLFGGLLATGRNGLIFEENGKVRAHVIFQRHGHDLHLFSLWVNPENRGGGGGTKAVEEFLSYAHEQRHIQRVRLGGGNDPVVNHLWEKLKTREKELHIRVQPQNWVELVREKKV